MSTKVKTQQPVQMGSDHSDEDSMSDDSTTEHSLKDSDSTPSDPVHGETRAVNFSKMLVYVILLVTGVALGVGMYFFLSNKEQDDFESQVRRVLLRSSMQPTR
jgi:hypothetical protein